MTATLNDQQKALTQEVIDHCWHMYQQGQISADHTAKQVFEEVLRSFAAWLLPRASDAPATSASAGAMKSVSDDPRVGVYKHLKTRGMYDLIGVGEHESTHEELAIYWSWFTGKIWVRPASEFFDGRFTRCGDPKPAATAPAALTDQRKAVIEECCAAIKAEDDRESDNDYMLDSDDCIRVLRALATNPSNSAAPPSNGEPVDLDSLPDWVRNAKPPKDA
jgi:hypothetical protein